MSGAKNQLDGLQCARNRAYRLEVHDPLQPDLFVRWPAYLTGFRREGGEVPCPVGFSTGGARTRT
jgi:hypothetical protein